jgi:hypothetical protein
MYFNNQQTFAKQKSILIKISWFIVSTFILNYQKITKGTLELRPMFHFTKKRIEAHVCICFVAYKVYKELERIIKQSNTNLHTP